MKVKKSEKLVWKHKCIPFYWLASIFGYSFPCIIFLIVIMILILLDYRGFSDIINIIIITPIALLFPFCLLFLWGKYFFILKVKKSRFSIKPKLLAFTKRFDLSEIKSIEFLLTKTRLRYSPAIFGSDGNLLYIYVTIILKDALEKTHVFNVIRFYDYKTTIDTLFRHPIEKRNAMKSRFINDLEDLKRLFPNLVSIRDEIQDEIEIMGV